MTGTHEHVWALYISQRCANLCFWCNASSDLIMRVWSDLLIHGIRHRIHVQGDTSPWFQPSVDIKRQVPYWPGLLRVLNPRPSSDTQRIRYSSPLPLLVTVSRGQQLNNKVDAEWVSLNIKTKQSNMFHLSLSFWLYPPLFYGNLLKELNLCSSRCVHGRGSNGNRSKVNF